MKLHSANDMKGRAISNQAVVEFASKVQRMERVHNYGLKDRPKKNIKEVHYTERPLLGLSKKDYATIEILIYEHLGKDSYINLS